ncbi:spore germination protein, partial [Paenibacillus graminis]
MPNQTQTSFPSVDQNSDYIEAALFNTNDLKKRSISFQGRKGVVLYLESITDTELIERNVIIPFSRNQDKDLSELFTTLTFSLETELN